MKECVKEYVSSISLFFLTIKTRLKYIFCSYKYQNVWNLSLQNFQYVFHPHKIEMCCFFGSKLSLDESEPKFLMCVH